VAIGSQLPLVIASFFLEHFEEMALEGADHKTLCWFCYMDDTFLFWPCGPDKLSEFLHHLNSIHENIQFNMVTKRDGHLPFFDTDITGNLMAHWVIMFTANKLTRAWDYTTSG
jgi:hypothetical protein